MFSKAAPHVGGKSILARAKHLTDSAQRIVCVLGSCIKTSQSDIMWQQRHTLTDELPWSCDSYICHDTLEELSDLNVYTDHEYEAPWPLVLEKKSDKLIKSQVNHLRTWKLVLNCLFQ